MPANVELRIEWTEMLERQISKLGGQSIGVTADVSKCADVEKLVDAAVERFSRLSGVRAARASAGPIRNSILSKHLRQLGDVRRDAEVVLLSGEAGIGKSRLTASLMERLVSEPHTRLRYFCSPQHTDSALYPIIGQMERAAGPFRPAGPASSPRGS
jgi:predicted ATPase